MDVFLELIAQNFWLVIIIVAGVIGSLRSDSSSEKEQRDYPPVRRTDRRQTNTRNRVPTNSRTQQTQPQTQAERNEIPQTKSLSIEELRKKQLAELEARTQSMYSSLEKTTESTTIKKTQDQLTHKENRKKQTKPLTTTRMQRMLSSEGIVDSIVMREILDHPRAKRPYRPRRYY